jgi:hypothetical protein
MLTYANVQQAGAVRRLSLKYEAGITEEGDLDKEYEEDEDTEAEEEEMCAEAEAEGPKPTDHRYELQDLEHKVREGDV